MKAVVYTEYGPPDVLRLEEMEKPSPGADQVLVQIHAASVNAYDWHLLKADPFFIRFMGTGFLKPKNRILGADVAGVVEAVGENVKRFKPGDEVFGDTSMSGAGSFAEYTSVRHDRLVLKPAGMSFEEAAAMPLAAVTALQGLREYGLIRSGRKVLINGASGGVGTFAIQIAKSFDTEVTAVCSTGKVEMARSLGADHVIDYTRENFTRSGKHYDLILAANGYQSVFAYKRALSPSGILVSSGGSMAQFFQIALLGPLVSMTGTRKIRTFVAKPNQEDLVFLTELFEAGKIKPVIDRRYPLDETADAIRYLDEGHAKGKVIISV